MLWRLLRRPSRREWEKCQNNLRVHSLTGNGSFIFLCRAPKQENIKWIEPINLGCGVDNKIIFRYNIVHHMVSSDFCKQPFCLQNTTIFGQTGTKFHGLWKMTISSFPNDLKKFKIDIAWHLGDWLFVWEENFLSSASAFDKHGQKRKSRWWHRFHWENDKLFNHLCLLIRILKGCVCDNESQENSLG